MKEKLKYWRDLTPQQRAELKSKHNVKTVSFEFIEKVYLLNKC